MKKFMLTLGIALIFTFFFGYAMEVFYEPPEYNCEPPRPKMIDVNKERQIIDDYYMSEEYQTCQEAYNIKRENHEFRSFITLSIIAILAIIASFLLANIEVVSSGILGGGIMTVIYAVTRYWGLLNKYLRLTILGLALIILVYYTYKRVDKAKKKR